MPAQVCEEFVNCVLNICFEIVLLLICVQFKNVKLII